MTGAEAYADVVALAPGASMPRSRCTVASCRGVMAWVAPVKNAPWNAQPSTYWYGLLASHQVGDGLCQWLSSVPTNPSTLPAGPICAVYVWSKLKPSWVFDQTPP